MTDYVNAVWGRDRVRLYRRDETARLIAHDVRADYAAFIREEDFQKMRQSLEKATASGGPIRLVTNDGAYRRLSFRDNQVRRDLTRPGAYFDAHEVTTYEGDVDPVRRFLIDTKAGIQKPRRAYLDLETDSRVRFINKERARILCWSLRFDDGNGIADVLEGDNDRAERDMLEALFEELDPYDQILAWNGDRFDFEMLKARIERLRLGIDMRRWLCLDHMLLFKKSNISASESGDEKQSVALNRVFESVCGIEDAKRKYGRGVGKLAGLEVGGRYAWEFWADGGENRQLLSDYNVDDAGMMAAIEKKTGYLDQFYEICAACGVFPETRGMRPVRFVETFMMRLGAERGVRAPTKWGGEEDMEKKGQFRGAWVMPRAEKTGVLRDVHIFDFSGMYPSIMIALNLSFDTRAPQHDVELRKAGDLPPAPPPGISIAPITGKAFRTDIEGLIVVGIKELRAKRAYWNKKKKEAIPDSPEFIYADRRATAYKNVINSLYGVLGSLWCRFYDRDVAESITQTGVFLIRETTFPEAKRLYPSIEFVAADTDSGFAIGIVREEMEALVAHCNRNVYPALLERLGAVDTSVVELAYEKEFSLMIALEARKRYAGRLKHYKGTNAPDNAKPVIKGLEFMRGDGAKLGRELQRSVVYKLLMIGQPLPADYPVRAEDFRAEIEEVQRHVLKDPLELREIVLAQALNKPLGEYVVVDKKDGKPGTKQAHVRVAEMMLEDGHDVGEGTRIEYVVTDGDAVPKTVVPIYSYQPGTEDRHYLWESKIWRPTMRVLQACFPGYRWERFDESKPRSHGAGRTRVLAGQSAFGFLADDWGDGDPDAEVVRKKKAKRA